MLSPVGTDGTAVALAVSDLTDQLRPTHPALLAGISDQHSQVAAKEGLDDPDRMGKVHPHSRVVSAGDMAGVNGGLTAQWWQPVSLLRLMGRCGHVKVDPEHRAQTGGNRGSRLWPSSW